MLATSAIVLITWFLYSVQPDRPITPVRRSICNGLIQRFAPGFLESIAGYICYQSGKAGKAVDQDEKLELHNLQYSGDIKEYANLSQAYSARKY